MSQRNGNFSPFTYDMRESSYERQLERKNRLNMDEDENFHTVVDSFERHSIPRRNEFLTRKETAFAEFNVWSPMDREEQILLDCVNKLINHYQLEPSADESLYQFIERCTIENL